MIIEIPDDNSIIKWKKNDKEDWKFAEISDLIKSYEERPIGDCISRSALKEAVINNFDNLQAYFPKDFIEEIDNASAVEARKQGEWKLHGMIYYCSVCGHDYEQGGNNFCGNCGAKMKGGA